MSASSKCMNSFLSLSHYQLWQLRNVIHLNEMHLIISRAADNAGNMSAPKIKSHNINSLCAPPNPKPFNILTSLSNLSSSMLCMLVACIAFKATTNYLLHYLLTSQNINKKLRAWGQICIYFFCHHKHFNIIKYYSASKRLIMEILWSFCS